MPNSEIADALRTSLRRHTAATVILYAVAIVAGLWIWSTARTNTHALCTFRGDLARRVTSTQQFLDHHPHGVAGISAPTIRASLRNERSAVDALAGLHCR